MTDEEFAKRFEEEKKPRPERCLWAWRYYFAPQSVGWQREYAEKGKLVCPVPGLTYPLGGWTFCGRNTVRVLSLNEAKAVAAAGLEWHHYENEPTDALRATEAPTVTEWPEGGFSMAHAALHAPARKVSCGACLVSLDRAFEHGHVKTEERLGEAVLVLDRGDGSTPTAEWWNPKPLYNPSGGLPKANQL